MKHVSLSISEYEFTHTACITFVVWSCVGWEAELQSGVPTHHTTRAVALHKLCTLPCSLIALNIDFMKNKHLVTQHIINKNDKKTGFSRYNSIYLK